MLLIEHHAMKA